MQTLFNRFVKSLKQNDRKNTCISYKTDVKIFLDKVIAIKNPKTENELCDILDGAKRENILFVTDTIEEIFEKNNYKISTKNRKLASLKCFFDFLTSYKLIKESPLVIKNYKDKKDYSEESYEEYVVRTSQEQKEFLTLEEMKNLLDSMEAHDKDWITPIKKMSLYRDMFVLSLMYTTGARIGEVLNIKNFDMEKTEYGTMINIRSHKCSRKIGAKRIGVGQRVQRYLEIYLALREQNMTTQNEYLIVSKTGKKIDEKTFRDNLNKYLKWANITKHITPHSQRHAFQTVASSLGVSERMIKIIGGWTLGSISNRYTHTTDKMLDKEKIKISSFL